MNKGRSSLVALALCSAVLPAAAQRSGQAKMPVREITVFKDGHAFVLHAGKMPTDAAGNVPLDTLPTPVLGTFWPYSADAQAQLTSVTSSPRKTTVARTALSLRELLEANPGAQVTVVQKDGHRYTARIVGVPKRNLEPPPLAGRSADRTQPGLSPAPLFDAGEGNPWSQADSVLLKTQEGVLALPFAQIKTATFTGPYKRVLTNEIFRNRMTLQLAWQGGKRGKSASVGMVYLQKGVRWIPNYKITIDGKGNAVVKLQATLINEMVDFSDVTAYLVIGVPTFALKDTPDPISLQQTFPELSRFFQPDSQTGFAFSNAIMSQSGGFGGAGGGRGSSLARPRGFSYASFTPRGQAEPPPGSLTADKNEDLFLFTVKHVTLKKGASIVIPVAEYPLAYQDVYTLEVRPKTWTQADPNLNREQAAELSRLLRIPRAQHKIRLTNRSPYPLTTAPALIISGNRVVSQAMMTYTAIGSETDVTLTTAGDIKVKKIEQETRRTPDALSYHGYTYEKVEMTGALEITNYNKQSVALETTRYVEGHTGKVNASGTATMVNADEDGLYFPDEGRYYTASIPGVNGIGRFTWKRTLSPGETVRLEYDWHYFVTR